MINDIYYSWTESDNLHWFLHVDADWFWESLFARNKNDSHRMTSIAGCGWWSVNIEYILHLQHPEPVHVTFVVAIVIIIINGISIRHSCAPIKIPLIAILHNPFRSANDRNNGLRTNALCFCISVCVRYARCSSVHTMKWKRKRNLWIVCWRAESDRCWNNFSARKCIVSLHILWAPH